MAIGGDCARPCGSIVIAHLLIKQICVRGTYLKYGHSFVPRTRQPRGFSGIGHITLK